MEYLPIIQRIIFIFVHKNSKSISINIVWYNIVWYICIEVIIKFSWTI